MTSFTLVIGNKNYSSWSLRPWLAMQQFGVEFSEVQIALYTPTAAAQIRQYSPAGKVPILLHGNLVIWDSLAILEYLAEQFPAQAWWGSVPIARAIGRSISAEMHSGFLALRHALPMNCRATVPGKVFDRPVQAEIDRITTIWRDCRQQLGQSGDFLFGEFTIADAMYAPVVLRFKTYGIALDPICTAYAETIRSLPALKNWLQAAVMETETIPNFEP